METNTTTEKAVAPAENRALNIATMLVRYEPGTKTLRTVPGNHCICALRYFTQIEGATDAALGGLDKLGFMLSARIYRNPIKTTLTG
jgi:hypothetical protein